MHNHKAVSFEKRVRKRALKASTESVREHDYRARCDVRRCNGYIIGPFGEIGKPIRRHARDFVEGNSGVCSR
jgi:hypothetical protein